MRRERVDVVVVGGGPAGLAAAWAAARRGRSVVLVEAATRLGGMAASVEIGGQRVDLGSHRLHPSAPPHVRALLDELLGDDLQVRTRDGRLRLAGRWVRFPLQVGDLLRSVPATVGLRIAADLATGWARRPRDDSYGEFVRAGLGPTTLTRFHGPMAEKLWGIPAGELAGSLARRRISVDGGRSLVRRIARTSQPGGRTFLYPRRGFGQIVERLGDAVRATGGQVRIGRTVVALTPGRPVALDLDDSTRLAADRVLWTAPASALAPLVGAEAPAAAEHRGVVLVYLVVDEARYSPVDAYYVPDPDVPFARLSEPKNYRDGPDPPGRTVLCAEIPASVGDARWRADDGVLGAAVLAGMSRVGLRVPQVAAVEVRRLARVYPVRRRGEGTASFAASAEPAEGVTLLGRQGFDVADNLHHVIDMGLSAAACPGDRGWDEERWRTELARFARFVVDD